MKRLIKFMKVGQKLFNKVNIILNNNVQDTKADLSLHLQSGIY